MSNLLDYIFNPVGTVLSSAIGAIGQASSNKAISKENEKSREFALDMWNRQNEYNLPINQMERLRQAGLNANLVYGDGATTLAAQASTPSIGTNYGNVGSHFKNLQNLYPQVKALDMQQDLVNSQVEVNDSVVQRNLADAQKTQLESGNKGLERTYMHAIIDKLQTDNQWNHLTMETRYNMLDLQNALLANNVDQALVKTRQILQATENDKRLTDMRIEVATNQIAAMWKRIDLDSKELTAKIELWAKQGNAAELAGKAAYLNAITNSNLFNLQKDKFNKFSDVQLDILKANLTKLNKQNGWIDILNEENLHELHMHQYYRTLNNSSDNPLDFMLDMTKDLIDFF